MEEVNVAEPTPVVVLDSGSAGRKSFVATAWQMGPSIVPEKTRIQGLKASWSNKRFRVATQMILDGAMTSCA